ncbi:MAG: hypothetical protein NTY98_06365 [Verrucomicrobia bacterium]|nr:hypothetical protein [Verrucomicrobiota bacterium]
MTSDVPSMAKSQPTLWDSDTLRSLSSESFNDSENELQHAVYECSLSPSFDNAEQVCLACRTSFIVFTHEHLTAGPEKRYKLLEYMLSLLCRAKNVVILSQKAILQETPTEQVQIDKISDYLRHIEDRISLTEVIRDKGMDAFKAELDRRIREINASNLPRVA